MQDLDKTAMGQRIRQIRMRQGLRQWELARLLGTTQSAVHKYEHGVVPEPRRLVELARIGGTSIEWVLTGQHWENGSTDQQRLPPDVLETATLLCDIGEDGRRTLAEALRISREAVRALRDRNGDPPDPAVVLAGLRSHSAATLELLESAWRVQRAVLQQVTGDAGRRLARGFEAHEPREDRPVQPR
jgi:transcriptional regulator with XRE-family HTH domain